MKAERPDTRKLKALKRGHIAEYRRTLPDAQGLSQSLPCAIAPGSARSTSSPAAGDVVACVEVKARMSLDDAVFAVTDTAQRRIRAASDLWLSRQGDFHRLSVRYDIVAVAPWRWPRHLPDAF